MGVKRLRNNNEGIALVAWVGIFIISAIGGWIAVENITQQPTITYNITESPFSFFGGAVDWIWIIVIGVVIVFALLWIFGKSKKQPTQQPQPYYRNGRY